MPAQQEIAARFRTIVENPPSVARKLPSGQSTVEDFRAEKYQRKIPNGRMTFHLFDASSVGREEGPRGLAVPTHGIEIFSHIPGTGITEHTFFGLRPDSEVERSHTVTLELPVFPIINVIAPQQSEALLNFAEDPDNERQLVIARELPFQQQDALNRRLADEVVMLRKMRKGLHELASERVYPGDYALRHRHILD